MLLLCCNISGQVIVVLRQPLHDFNEREHADPPGSHDMRGLSHATDCCFMPLMFLWAIHRYS